MLEDKILGVFEGDNGLFKDKEVFDVHHIPEKFLFRDQQMKTLASNIKPAFNGGGPVHTVILGDHATGKTTAMKKLFEIIETIEPRIIPVYINCKTYNTKFKIYSIIFEKVFKVESLKRGTSAAILFDKIMKGLKQKKQILIVVLDDVNYLLEDNKGQELFYELTRAYEMFKVKIGIYPILTGMEFRYTFDKNIRTIFIPQEIIFPYYTFDEIYSILKKRACVGFQKGVIDQEILLRVSEVTKDSNNLRLGLNILQNLGIMAENEGSNHITNNQFNQLIKSKQKYL
ncbi:MAG: AAA family ATPase [Methanobrevibacter sp.]|nr:AAA family ATPase [Methanobrevibacter sp.]